MKKLLRYFFIFLFFSPCIAGFSQNTITHDIPWQSDTVGMWGPSSSVWSINQVDTLVDFSIGPYENTYSNVYHPPLVDSVGIIFDYGASLDLQLVFQMVGWSSGGVNVNYPTEIKMDFPPDSSFSNGNWVTIPSEYREQDTLVHPTDTANWDIWANFPDAGKIELFLCMKFEANVDLIFSDFTDPLNIVWDTMHIIEPVNAILDTFDIFLIDVPNNEYIIPWVDYHTDPLSGNIIIDSVYLLHDTVGLPLFFPEVFYDLIGISGDISVPDISEYIKWIDNEQRLNAWGSDEYLHINLNIIKFVQVMCHYLSYIPSLEELEAVSQAFQYIEGDTSIYLFTDPISGEDFTADIYWDLIDAELLFTNTMNQTITFEDNKEYSFFGIPIPPKHYPNVWNVFKFPMPVDYEVLDTLGAVIESGNSDSMKFGSDYDLRLRLPCNNYDSIPATISHTIDPWLTNFLRDSVSVDFYISVLNIFFYFGTISNPVYTYDFVLYENTLHLGEFEGPPWFGPPVFMPWLIDGNFNDTTFVPDEYLIPANHPLADSIITNDIACYGTNTGSATVIAYEGMPPYTYQWSNGDTIISTDTTIYNLGVGTYFVTVTDSLGCMIEDSATFININPPISISHISNNVLCYGDSTGSATIIVTGGAPPYQYTWSPDVGTDEAVSNLYAGTYYVNVLDDAGCKLIDTITISEPDSALQITILNVANVTCYNGSNGSIDISVAGGTASYTYEWSDGFTSQNINNLTEGNYIITVTDANACTSIDSVAITQPDEIIAYVHDLNICYGQSVVIAIDSTTGGTPPYNYFWSTGESGSTINVNPSVFTSYSVYAVDSNNCIGDSSTLNIQVTEPLSFDLTTSKDTICFGDSTQLFASVTGGGGPPYIIYINNIQTESSPVTVIPTETTSYIATVWDSCHFLSLSDTVKITVMPLPLMNFNVQPTSGCQPLTVSFSYLTSDTGLVYSWNFGDGNSGIDEQDIEHIYNTSGFYDISLIVTTAYGCTDSITNINMIEVWTKPIASFTQDNLVVDLYNPLVNFYNQSSTTFSSFWNFGDGTTSVITDPSHQFPAVDTFNIMLIAESNHGCLDTAWNHVIVKDTMDLFVPNVFSPDGNGINDVFKPEGNINPHDYKMLIFDRWGENIFESTDILKGWDGTVKGKPVEEDAVFIYTIVYKNSKGVLHKLVGDVTLLHTYKE